MSLLNAYRSMLTILLTVQCFSVFNSLCSHVGPVLGGKRSSHRARGLQWDEASGPGHRLSEHIGGGDSVEERGQAR